MNISFTKYLFAITIVVIANSYAQNKSVRFNHIDVEDGLSENTTKAILQDSEGFIWIATWNGLSRYDGYEFKVYKHVDGDSTSLRLNKITCLLEDHYGRLWVGTFGGGLSLFNKERETFTNFVHNPKNKFSISSNQILTLFEDSNNRIWIGTNLVGVSLVDNNLSSAPDQSKNIRFINFKNDPQNTNSITGNGVMCLNENNTGTIWLGSKDGTISKLIQDENSYDDYRFTNFQQQTKTNSNFLLNFLIEDKFHPELLWIDDYYRGLIWFNTKFEKFITKSPYLNLNSNLPINEIQSMLITGDGEYWFGTAEHGIYSFNPSKNNDENPTYENFNITSLAKPFGIDAADITNIYEDASGLIWLGTNNNGIFTFQKRTQEFISYHHNYLNDNSLISDNVLHVFEDKNGNLWIGTDAGLDKYDPVKQKYTHFKHSSLDKESINSNVVYTVIQDSVGTIWIGTDKGLDKYNPSTNSFSHFFHNANDTNSISKGLIINTFVDSKGTLWIGGWSGGLNKLITTPEGQVDKFIHYTMDANDPHSISDNSIMSFAESNDGTLWIGTAYGGLNKLVSDYKVAEDGAVIKPKFKNYQSDPSDPNSISGNDVRSICIDKNGTYWIGTFGGGLNKFKPPESENEPAIFYHYRESDGLANDVVKRIRTDNEGNLWISSSHGLSRFNPHDNSFLNFYVSDGLPFDKFGGVCYKDNTTGRLYFGGVGGLISFIPRNIIINEYKPEIVITSFKRYNADTDDMIEEKGISAKEKIVLSYDDNILNFEFSALSFFNSLKNSYAYKLEGYNDNWIQLGNKRDVTFTNLDPGSYTLFVRGSNNDGVWSENATALEIIITPPWWRTPLAYIIYGILFLAGIFTADRFQRKRLQEKERRIAREKELEQAKEIERAYNKLKTTQSQLIHSEKMASLGELTAGIAHEIKNPLNFVNNFSEITKELLDEMKAELENNNKKDALEIAENLMQNLEKINQHGKRADSIVKGMLLHSRGNSGEVVLTDINYLLGQYVDLAYHGMRAQNKEFNIAIEKDYDDTLEKINVVPQDLSRVFLNIINNACYAAFDRKQKNSDNNFSPALKVSTKNLNEKVEIQIRDNGNGIPKEARDYLFNPFFTTKPSGEGTGLGLSLSYEIIVKQHNGTLRFETKENEFTEFIITIPKN